ncbi:unnamed protein product [Schistosoma mattheei]|uniref:Uncharacterized protein n=1 Tax=Schistosoma mattheei TaxID=31246 RepID=A0A3P8JC52_9TREM|nr:unnamed protein product [Schistosoma mattheei]
MHSTELAIGILYALLEPRLQLKKCQRTFPQTKFHVSLNPLDPWQKAAYLNCTQKSKGRIQEPLRLWVPPSPYKVQRYHQPLQFS